MYSVGMDKMTPVEAGRTLFEILGDATRELSDAQRGKALCALEDLVEAERLRLVGDMRGRDHSWASVARVIGMTDKGAWKKYHKVEA